jgi:hypothetical protein
MLVCLNNRYNDMAMPNTYTIAQTYTFMGSVAKRFVASLGFVLKITQKSVLFRITLLPINIKDCTIIFGAKAINKNSTARILRHFP